jgi:hypothetical protein
MTPRRPALIVVGAFFAIVASARNLRSDELTDANYEKLRDSIVPTTDELAWKKIPWRASFWEAVVEGHQKEKPILLWVMNGHALCNT